MNQASRDKCLKEIQLLQSLRHTNIIRYEDSYIDLQTNELVIVLQWARGGDLKKLLKKVKSGQAKITEFSEGMIWKYASELAGGLEYMHEKRVMHRDLKPANIMLSEKNQVLLGDLGLSRYFNPQTLEAFSKVGTVRRHNATSDTHQHAWHTRSQRVLTPLIIFAIVSCLSHLAPTPASAPLHLSRGADGYGLRFCRRHLESRLHPLRAVHPLLPLQANDGGRQPIRAVRQYTRR